LYDEYEQENISLEDLKKLTGGPGFKTRPSHAEIMEEEKQLADRKNSPKTVQSISDTPANENGQIPGAVS
jgi:hypothetical protein